MIIIIIIINKCILDIHMFTPWEIVCNNHQTVKKMESRVADYFSRIIYIYIYILFWMLLYLIYTFRILNTLISRGIQFLFFSPVYIYIYIYMHVGASHVTCFNDSFISKCTYINTYTQVYLHLPIIFKDICAPRVCSRRLTTMHVRWFFYVASGERY